MTVAYTFPSIRANGPQSMWKIPIDQALVATLTAETTTADTHTADQANSGAQGIRVLINISAISGTGATLTVNIQEKDSVSGTYITRLASVGLTATGETVLTLYPSIAVTVNVSANDVLGGVWRIQYVISGTAPSVTATINVQTLP